MTEPTTEAFLRTYMADFHAFIVRVYTALPRNLSRGTKLRCAAEHHAWQP